VAHRDHVPERTCAGCREKAPKGELLRVVRRTDGVVAPDPSGVAPGRGGYVHRDPSCVEAALARGGLSRALRTRVGQDAASRLRELTRGEREQA
jgi:hypothetical protein